MKTEEDEAFDELARKQGMWGGGFQAKRQMAADKLHWSDCAVHNGPAYPAAPCDCGVAQEPPKYAIRAYWEDGRIGVVATVERPDGGVHLLNSIIDSPKRPWVELADEEMEDIRASFLGQFLETWEFAYKVQVATQAKLKERNT